MKYIQFTDAYGDDSYIDPETIEGWYTDTHTIRDPEARLVHGTRIIAKTGGSYFVRETTTQIAEAVRSHIE